MRAGFGCGSVASAGLWQGRQAVRGIVMFFVDAQIQCVVASPDFAAQYVGLAGQHDAAVQIFDIVAFAQAVTHFQSD